ncbi:MAG: glycosyltransferase family 4 protein [Bacteroidetes bacterium]|nr:glycosyltransferase family 4 protein [Bacteroidota bacterium]
MRIAIIAGSIPTTTFIDALVNGMAEQGYTMVVIGKRKSNYQYSTGVECIEVPHQKISQLFFVLRLLRHARWAQLRRIYKTANSFQQFFYDLLFYLPLFKSKADKVHIQWAATLYNRALLFDLFPHKIILSLRGAHINYTPIIKPEIGEYYKLIFPKVYKFHAVSNAIALEAVKYGADITKIQTIYSFVDEIVCDTKPLSRGNRQKLRIISIGRFHWKKGYEFALDALCMVKKENIDFEYTIVAQGHTPESILFQTHQLGLNENIKIINGLSHQEVLNLVSMQDLFLLPSIEEGIANVVLEAMALGVPVISTNCGGMNEVIEDEINGYLVDLRNPRQLASKIMAFNSISEDEKTSLIAKAKDTIKNHHSKTLFFNQYKHFYS